ncbi:hypothetical protein [Chishuiella changwenlii]|uniref:hypothetical protein n=1 Tax=Chishuiella changwenlii TaxID=1434701 RepID=UPI002FDAADEA
MGYILLYKIYPKFSNQSQIISFFIGLLGFILLSIFVDTSLATLISIGIITCTLFIIDSIFSKNKLNNTINSSKNNNYDNKLEFQLNNKNIKLSEIVEELEKENFFGLSSTNLNALIAIQDFQNLENKINWIDKSPTNSKLNNLKTLIFLLQNLYNLKNIDSTIIYKELFLKYFNIDRDVSKHNFTETYSKVLQEFNFNRNKRFDKISEILKLD